MVVEIDGAIEPDALVRVKVHGLAEWADGERQSAWRLVPHVDGRPLPGIYPSGVSLREGWLQFHLRVTPSNDRLLNRQRSRQLHVWVAKHRQGHWLGRVALFAHQQRGQAWGLVAYQTDLDHCRLGVATQLVRQCVIEAVALGYSWLDAQVTHDNEASMAVLTRCGFQHDGPDEPAELTRGIVQTLRLRRVVQVPGPLVLHDADVRLTS